VVVGASAGGIRTLEELLGGLPADFGAAVFVVVHTSPQSPGVLARMFSRAGPLRAAYAVDGEQIEHGRVYVAPSDRHLLVERGHVRVTRGPRENRFRPSVDALFRSAATAYGPRVIGIVLSGMLSDGAAGLWTVKDRGGLAIVQDPNEALFGSMPSSAMEAVDVDACLPVREISQALVNYVGEEVSVPNEAHPRYRAAGVDRERAEVRIAMEDNAMVAGVMRLGQLAPYACPECHGVLLQVRGEGPLRFRCHTGHAYTAEALLSALGEAIEASVWSAVRAIEERIMLLEHLAGHVADAGRPDIAKRHLADVQGLKRRLDQVRATVIAPT
jgi:two-component system chemotaxis response regulator CheB